MNVTQDTKFEGVRPFDDWYDSLNERDMCGIQVKYDGKWRHYAEDGSPCIYEDRDARDRKVSQLLEKVK